MRIGLGQNIFQLHQRNPLLAGGALFLCGIYLGYAIPCLHWTLSIVGLSLCAGTFLSRRKIGAVAGVHWAGLFVIALSALFLGIGRAAWDRAGREEERAWLAGGEKREPSTVRCCIGPDVVASPMKGRTVRYSFKTFDVRVQPPQGEKVLAYLPLTVNWYASVDDQASAPQPGETWQFRGRLTTAKARRSQLLVATLNTGKRETRSVRLSAGEEGVWPLRIAQMRSEAMRRIALGIEDWRVAPALNQAMLLGYNSEMPQAMRRIFSDSGTIHVFAVSGLHIAFVAGLLVLLAGMTGIKRVHWVFIIAPLLIGYTLITGARPSAIRACVMTLFMLVAPLVGRRPTMLSALTLTALLVHAWRPDFIFDIGSILSFAVMLGLIAFMGPFCTIFQTAFGCVRMKRKEELLRAAGNTKRAAWIRRGGIALRFLADSFAVSLAAFLASVPLTGYYFGRFTPGGLLANLVITPCSGLIVAAGTLGLITSYIHTWLASTFNHAAAALTMIMVKTAELTAGCPVLGYDTGKWAPWQVVLWLAGLVGLGLWISWRSKPMDGLAWLKEEEK